MPSRDVAEAFREDVRRARRELGIRADYEFKFFKTWHYPERREAFYRAAMRQPFRFTVASIDKRTEDWSHADGPAIHWAAAVSLAATLRPIYMAEYLGRAARGESGPLNELVVVDDNQDRDFLAMVRETFRTLGQRCQPRVFLVGKVRFGGSEPDELLQLADMVCGAYGSYEDGDDTWYRMIAARDLGKA